MNTPTLTINPEVRSAILAAKRGDKSIDFGPPGSMATPLYKQVVKVLDQLAIKWDKKLKCHCSESPIGIILDAALSDGVVRDERKTFQFFSTVSNVAWNMARAALKDLTHHGISPTRLLEPSGGDGALVRAVQAVGPEYGHKSFSISIVELDGRHESKLRTFNPATLFIGDFLSIAKDTEAGINTQNGSPKLGEYDVIIMNPPFSGGRDLAHIAAAVKLLRPGGTCVALCGSRWEGGNKSATASVTKINEICNVEVLETRVKAGADTGALSTMYRLIRK